MFRFNSKQYKKLRKIIAEFKFSIIPALIGFALIGLGLSIDRLSTPVPKAADQTQTSLITFDIAGGVRKPGVYQIKDGSLVYEAVSLAGGFSENADKEWIAKSLNLASRVENGQKIYIPLTNENQKTNIDQNSKININSATKEQLDSLPDIGGVRAEKIISNRPYSKIEDLVNKKVIGESTFEKIKDKISVY